MKKYIHSLLFLACLLAGNGLLAQNISTGLNAAGTGAIAIGASEPTGGWKITAGPSGAVIPKREPSYGTYWEPTPAANFACWLSQSGVNGGDPAGYYTFERTFNVSANDGGIIADFGMAVDDILISAALIPPTGPAIPLSMPMGVPNQYWIGASVNHCVANPEEGDWKIQAVVRWVDNLGGFMCSGFIRHCPKINISTGIDNNGNSIAIGAQDPNWNITAGPGTGITHREATFPWYWQPTPVTGTNAGWINSTGTWNDPVGIETFDRTFNIASGTASFTTAFAIAWDDALVSLELIPPGPGTPIPLTPVMGINVNTGLPCQYWLGPDINYTVTAPATGLWTVRAKVHFIDQLGGFMLSGYISTLCCPPDPCNCEMLQPEFSWVTDADCNTHFTASSGASCLQDVQATWMVDGNYVGSGMTFDYAFPGNGTYNVCLIASSPEHGEDCFKEVCHEVTINCNPCECEGLTVDFDSRTDGCVGTFTGIAQGNTCMQQFDYEWTVNGAPAGSGQTLGYSFPGNGIYYVCVKVTTYLPDGTECTEEKCKEVVIQNCNPGQCDCSQLFSNFTYIVDKCNIRLTAAPTIPACMTNPTYVWTVNGAFAGTGPVINKTVTGNGTYVVCLLVTVTKPDGTKCERQLCKDIVVSGCTKSLSIGIPDESVVLYPNPATDELNIDFTTTESGETTITFKTVDGKVVLSETKATEAGAQHFRLGIPSSVAGELIFVEITNGTQQIIRKVTIQKH